MKIRGAFIMFVLIVASGFAWRPSLSQAPGQQYFPETGHTVRGEFLDAYQSAINPLVLYGYPITEAYQDQTTGQIVQYFQRARFELHPEAEPEARIQLTPLGQYLYVPGQTLPIPGNNPACRTFSETGFQVCYAFLEFFDAYGGAAQFGNPISGFENHDERIVQYFERARFEWYPELPTGKRVKLADLGTRYFEVRGENSVRLLPKTNNNILPTILELQVRAFPEKAVGSESGEQTVHVVVQDQNRRPVPNAQVFLFVYPPGGEEARYILPLTDEEGISWYTFQYSAGSKGVARVTAIAMFEHLLHETVTSFRIWW